MTLNDKIKGAVYGMAIGDALGLGTEFMSRDEVQKRYPGGLRHLSQIIRDSHRAQFKRGSWTNDTEITLLVIESLIACGHIDYMDVALRIRKWFDTDPVDLVSLYRIIKHTPGWENHPHEAAQEIRWRRDTDEASNEAIPRALISGIMARDREELIRTTADLIQITQDDSRCVCSAACIAQMANDLLWNDRVSSVDDLLAIANRIDQRTVKFIIAAHDGNLEDLNLDDADTMWYTRRAMSAALWAIWHLNNPTDILHAIVDAGGDADTNAALAMGIAGLKFGFDALPEETFNISGIERLDEISERFCKFMSGVAEERSKA